MGVIVLVVTLVGTIAAEKTATLLGKEDPKEVVIDEVAGQGIALMFCPLDGIGSSLRLFCFACLTFLSHGPWGGLIKNFTVVLASWPTI